MTPETNMNEWIHQAACKLTELQAIVGVGVSVTVSARFDLGDRSFVVTVEREPATPERTTSC